MATESDQPYPMPDGTQPYAPPPQQPPMYPPYPMMPWMPMPYMPPPPRPRGPPRKALFQVGAVGLFVLAGSSIASGVLWLINFSHFSYSYEYPWHITITGVLAVIAMSMASVGYFGLYRNYGSLTGAAAAIYGLVAAGLFAGLSVASIQHQTGGYYYDYSEYTMRMEILWAGYAIYAVAPILMGVAHAVSRFHLTIPGLGIASAVLMIIAGGFVTSLILAFVGFFILAAGGIVGGINFARAPVYDEKMAQSWQQMMSPMFNPMLAGPPPQFQSPGSGPPPANGWTPPKPPY